MSKIYCDTCNEFMEFTYNNNNHYNCKMCGSLLGFNKDAAEQVRNGKPILGDGFCFQWHRSGKFIQPRPSIDDRKQADEYERTLCPKCGKDYWRESVTRLNYSERRWRNNE